MKKIIVLLIFLFSFNVYAATCEKEELARLKNLAEQIEFTYDYEIKENDNDRYLDLSIKAINLNKELKVLIINNFYNDGYREFVYNDSKTYTLKDFIEGEKVVVTIKAYTANGCSSKTILTKTINLPFYNNYYDDEFCKVNSDFKFCTKIIEKKINYDTYQNAINDYFKEEKTEDNGEVIKQDSINYIIYIIIFAIFVLIISLVIYLANKRKKERL